MAVVDKLMINDFIKKGDLNDMPQIIYNLKKDLYKCTSVKTNKWYQFLNNHWIRLNASQIISVIINEFYEEYVHYITQCSERMFTENCQYEREILNINLLDTKMKIKKIKKPSFNKYLLSSCSHLLYDDSFEKKLDTDPYLIGFENGVYDLSKKQFRRGVLNDFISQSTGYDYPSDTTQTDTNQTQLTDIIKQTELFLKEILDDDIRDYVLSNIAAYLEGIVRKELIMILIGNDWKKNRLIELIIATFGDYFDVLPIQHNTDSEQLYKKHKKRFILIKSQQPTLHTDSMLDLVNGGVIVANIYSDTIMYKPQFKILYTFNTITTVDEPNPGLYRRLRIINQSNQSNDVPISTLIDELITNDPNELIALRQGFVWLLINKYYPMYVNCEITETPSRIVQQCRDLQYRSLQSKDLQYTDLQFKDLQ